MNFATQAMLGAGAGFGMLRGTMGSIWRGAGGAGRAALTGAAIGAGVGMISDNTSVLGGAMTGAVGGLAWRWGRAGVMAANRAMGPKGATTYNMRSAFLGGIGRRVTRDVRSNRPINKIASTLKGWQI